MQPPKPNGKTMGEPGKDNGVKIMGMGGPVKGFADGGQDTVPPSCGGGSDPT